LTIYTSFTPPSLSGIYQSRVSFQFTDRNEEEQPSQRKKAHGEEEEEEEEEDAAVSTS
jgi:hypothetical protein